MSRMILMIIFLLFVAPLTVKADELQERKKMSLTVTTLLLSENFAELEQLANEFRTKQNRSQSGLWMLTLFYAGIYEATDNEIRDEQYWADIEGRTLRWAKLYPNSPTPHIAYSITLINHAWSFRGNGWAREVHPEDWKPFFHYVGKARENLIAHKNIAKSDPRWYETMLIVAKAENWDITKFNALVDEALSIHPYFYQIYFAAIDYLTPKWHGDKNKIEAFAKLSIDRTKTLEASGMYARVYWYASQANYGERLFTDSLVVWSKMKQGIDDVLSRYPDQWNINNFARFACLASDQNKTKELIRLVKTPLPEAWTDQYQFDKCRSWANGEPDPSLLRLHAKWAEPTYMEHS